MEHKIYDPKFGDDRMCKCGHEYHRHFNPKTGEAWGCFFNYNCGCEGFDEAEKGLNIMVHPIVAEEQVKELLLDIFHTDDWQGSEPYRILKKWLEDTAGIIILPKNK